MFGLIKDFAITTFIIILSHWSYGVEDDIAFDFLVGFIARNQTLFFAYGILGLVTLLILATIFQEFGLYKITYGLSKILVRLVQFLITFLGTLNIVFYSAGGMNLLKDSGYFSLIVLFMILGSSCWTIRMNDFNYNTQNALMPVSLFTVMSVVLVQFIWPVMGF
jgi:hypothetical protein